MKVERETKREDRKTTDVEPLRLPTPILLPIAFGTDLLPEWDTELPEGLPDAGESGTAGNTAGQDRGVGSATVPGSRGNGNRDLAVPVGPGAVTEILAPFDTAGPRSVHLTERQLIWISWRLSTEDDMTACVRAEVEPGEVLEWRKSTEFNDAVISGLQDKRGSFRPLTENMLPLVLRTIYDLLANGSNKDREKALGHLLKIQGLSVDVVRSEDAETMQRMVERMRQPVVISIANPDPRP